MRCALAYDQIDRTEWQRLVRESRTGTWFQSPDAYDFYASLPDICVPSVCAVYDDLSRLRALCVAYVTVESNPVLQFFSRRAILVGGPLLADDATRDEVIALLHALRAQLSAGSSTPIYIESRNFNDYSAWKAAFEEVGFTYHPHLNFHIDTRSTEQMNARISDNRIRQIKKAQKNGAVIEEARSEADIVAFYHILRDVYARKVKTPLFPLPFFLQFYRQNRGRYLLVKLEGKVIGGVMCPVLEGKTIYEWYICGDDLHFKAQNPSVMATWAAMDYAATHRLQRFDVMGAGVPNQPYGVRDFKAEFGGELVEYGRWLYVRKPILYKLGCLGVKILKGIR